MGFAQIVHRANKNRSKEVRAKKNRAHAVVFFHRANENRANETDALKGGRANAVVAEVRFAQMGLAQMCHRENKNRASAVMPSVHRNFLRKLPIEGTG